MLFAPCPVPTQSFDNGVSNLAFDVKRKEFEDQSVLIMTRDS
jgi:hypothetical protein